MPKYRVTLAEAAMYEVIVEAANPEEAAVAAEQAFVNSEDISEFPTTIADREAAEIEEITDQEEE